MRSRLALLPLLAALAACSPGGSSPTRGAREPKGLEISYLAPLPDQRPPLLRGKFRNETGRAIRLVEYDLFYGVGGVRELDPLVIRDVPARGFREFEVPLPLLEDRPTTWETRFVRVEWAGTAPPPAP